MRFEDSSSEAKSIMQKVRFKRRQVNECIRRKDHYNKQHLKQGDQYDWLKDQHELRASELNALEFEMTKMKDKWKEEQK